MIRTLTQEPGITTAPRALDAAQVHTSHADFVWKSLHCLGVREADLQDVFQEVFVVVHRRIASYDHESRLTTWLFGIAMRVASQYRRRAYRRRESVGDGEEPGADCSDGVPDPEDQAALAQARSRLAAVLDAMDLEKRVVFVMFEIEQIPCAQIAEIVGVPVGTVHSRLHAARKAFAAAAAQTTAAPRGARRQP